MLNHCCNHHRCRKHSSSKARSPRQDNQESRLRRSHSDLLLALQPTNTSVSHTEGMFTGNREELGCSPSPGIAEAAPCSEENWEVWILPENNPAMECHPSPKENQPSQQKTSLSKLWVISITKADLQINWKINLPAEYYSSGQYFTLPLQSPSLWKHPTPPY